MNLFWFLRVVLIAFNSMMLWLQWNLLLISSWVGLINNFSIGLFNDSSRCVDLSWWSNFVWWSNFSWRITFRLYLRKLLFQNFARGRPYFFWIVLELLRCLGKRFWLMIDQSISAMCCSTSMFTHELMKARLISIFTAHSVFMLILIWKLLKAFLILKHVHKFRFIYFLLIAFSLTRCSRSMWIHIVHWTV